MEEWLCLLGQGTFRTRALQFKRLWAGSLQTGQCPSVRRKECICVKWGKISSGNTAGRSLDPPELGCKLLICSERTSGVRGRRGSVFLAGQKIQVDDPMVPVCYFLFHAQKLQDCKNFRLCSCEREVNAIWKYRCCREKGAGWEVKEPGVGVWLLQLPRQSIHNPCLTNQRSILGQSSAAEYF